jgi:hypothetical protein
VNYQLWKDLARPDDVCAADARVDELDNDAKVFLHTWPTAELVRLQAYRLAVQHKFYSEDLDAVRGRPGGMSPR